MGLIAELQRRSVFKVGAAYLLAAWLLLQVTEVLAELLQLSTEIGKIVIVLVAVGFVPALVLAWVFELTPDGVRRESEIDRTAAPTPQSGRKLNALIIVMLFLVAGYFFWEARIKAPEPAAVVVEEPTKAPAPGPDTAPSTSIVVLPFVNMSRDPDQEFFSDGLSEEILNAIARIDGLRVISRTSAFAFKGKGLSIPSIAETLDVSHVLEGSVRTMGNDVRISAQLIDVASDSQLWSDSFTLELEDVFEIQEQISRAIARELRLQFGVVEATERPTDDIEAYRSYLRGRHLYQSRSDAAIIESIELLERAVAIDPTFDEAWATLAAALTVRSFGLAHSHQATLDKAIDAAATAIELAPRNGLAHGVRGMHLYARLDFEASMAALSRAIELSPSESNAFLWRGIIKSSLGYQRDALTDLQAAERLDPVFVNLQQWLSEVHYIAGNTAQARHHLDKALELDPDFTVDPAPKIAEAEGDLDRAEALALDHYEYVSTEQVRAYFAALRDPARVDDAVKILSESRTDDWVFTLYPPLLRFGRVNEAIDAWKAVVAAGRGLRAVNRINAIWEPTNRALLTDPAVIAFFEEIGFADYWRQHGSPDLCRPSGVSFTCGQ